MIRNYLLITFRNLLKYKFYVLVNTSGLGVSLACCLTAYALMAYNIEFDGFHKDEKVGNVYKVHTEVKEGDGGISEHIKAPVAFGSSATRDIAGITRFTRFIKNGGEIQYNTKTFSQDIAFADSTFFDMFDFPLAKGDFSSFKEKQSIFLSEELAAKYFGDEDPIGKVLSINFSTGKINVVVGGVFKFTPLNNTFFFEAMLRFEHFLDIKQIKEDSWEDGSDPPTFVALASSGTSTMVSQLFDKYAAIVNESNDEDKINSFTLVPFKPSFSQTHVTNSRHVVQKFSNEPLIIFDILAGLILLIACFNLTNTSIATTSKRLKEIGLRKTVGATRGQIITQFLIEISVTIILSIATGLLIAQWLVPEFTSLLNFSWSMESITVINLLIALLVLALAVAFLAGFYPALFMSRFTPVVLLKGVVKINGTNWSSRVLVVLQFSLSVIALVGGAVFVQNAAYLKEIDFGYDKEMLLTVSVQDEKEFRLLENEIATNPKIIDIAATYRHIGMGSHEETVNIDETQHTAWVVEIGKNYLETMGMDLLQGRTLDANSATDLENGLVVNEFFMETTGLSDPLGKTISMNDTKRRIVGVVKDHIENLMQSTEPQPFVYYLAPSQDYKLMVVKTNSENLISTKNDIEQAWQSLFPDKPFDSRLQEDIVLTGLTRINSIMTKILMFITILGSLLSIAGIFALASLNTKKQTKQIGIRKVLGAHIGDIISVMNKEFVIILLSASLVGAIGGYFLVSLLLDTLYKDHVNAGFTTVVVCSALLFFVGFFTTKFTISKAARANPIDTLRSE